MVRFSLGDGYGDLGRHYIPKSGLYRSVFIFLHGLGDTADGWVDVFENMVNHEAHLANQTKIILPTAQTIPVALNMNMSMPAWTNIYGLSEKDPEDLEGFRKAASRIQNIMEHEQKDKGIKPERIMIGGFSQGGAMTYFVGSQQKQPLGGLMVLSGWLPCWKDICSSIKEGFSKTPIFHGHGTADGVVAHEFGRRSLEKCQEAGNELTEWHSYEKLGHGSCPEELVDIKSFIKKHLLSNLVC